MLPTARPGQAGRPALLYDSAVRPVLVTGARGFVGPHLLAELGDRAVPTDADVTDGSAVADAVRESRPAAVVHLAGLTSVASSWEEAAPVWDVNVVGTVRVLEAVAAEAPDARVLFVSTGEIYGRAEVIPTPEDAPVAPLSPYAASKAAAELACAQARRAGRLDVVVARAFQHAGPGQDERFAIPSWANQIARLEETDAPTIEVGDVTVERDLVDVRDVARAYVSLVEPTTPSGVYNVASGRPVAMSAVLDVLVRMARSPVEFVVDPDRLRRAKAPVLSGDPARLRAATGWEPKIPLEQTLADVLQEARSRLAEKRVPLP